MTDGNDNQLDEKKVNSDELDTMSDEALLREIDVQLNEADPEFMKSLEEIKAVGGTTDLSVLGDPVDLTDLENSRLPPPKMSLKEKLFQVVDVKSINIIFPFSSLLDKDLPAVLTSDHSGASVPIANNGLPASSFSGV